MGSHAGVIYIIYICVYLYIYIYKYYGYGIDVQVSFVVCLLKTIAAGSNFGFVYVGGWLYVSGLVGLWMDVLLRMFFCEIMVGDGLWIGKRRGR